MRRHWLLLLALSAISGASLAAGMGVADARHLLNRAGFGARPETIVEYSRLSHQAAVERILRPVPVTTQVAVPEAAAEYLPRSALREQRAESEAAKVAVRRDLLRRGYQLRGWWVEEMLAADTPALQLRERMVLFWHNHFVSAIKKVKMPSVMLEQNRLFRQHGLGNFEVLLREAVKSPAMLVYLDAATNRQGKPNENLARELLELFTLGEGHYSEQDVKEAARALTGWSVNIETGRFIWRPMLHDSGEKQFLGQRGRFDGDAIVSILLRRPEMAEFIVSKLWREFISPEPDAAEVTRIAQNWQQGGYALRPLLASLFNAPAFWAPRNRGTLIKSPADLVIGTLHTFGNVPEDGLPFAFAMAQLGQDLFNPPNVKGWPGGEAWINSNTLLLRKQMLDRILRSEGRMGGSTTTGKRRGRQTAARDSDADEFEMKRRFLAAIEATYLDQSGWQRRLQQQGLQSAQVLLALPEAAGGSGDLRSVLLDAGYQLR